VIWALWNRFLLVVWALAVGCLAACSGGVLTQAPTPSVASSSSSSTLATPTAAASASSTRGITKKFQLTIVGPIQAGDIFQVGFAPSPTGQSIFEFCGQTTRCAAGQITRTLGIPYGAATTWKFEKTTGPSGPITVFKQGTDPMTSDSTITATYTYQ
jgi:hypothetical protein